MPISPIKTHCQKKILRQNSKRSLTIISLALAMISILPTPSIAKDTSAHPCAYSPFNELKYTPKSTHFNYVNKDAPKGGRVRIARIGTFDSLNFLRYPGTTIGSRTQIPLAISDYLFDSFLTKSADEPASYYCLAASKIEVSRDLSKVTFTLNPKAKWHDGNPITVDDILFTFKILKRQGAPYYRQILRQITASSKQPHTIIYTNGRKGDRNFANLVGTLPIHPKHFWKAGKLTKKTMFLPLGSGPYKITSARAGKTARLTRVKNYWAKDLFSQKGRHNFDEIKLDYYRDDRSALEAYKVGNYDIRVEQQPVAWSREYEGNSLTKDRIKKNTGPCL